MRGWAMFALGAAAMAIVGGSAWLGCERLKSMAPERLAFASASSRVGNTPKCRSEVWPRGVVHTPAQAELVFRSAFPDERFVRTRVRVTGQGDFWLVDQHPPERGLFGGYWMGGVLIVRISKCDGAITFVEGEE
jgi:hypothetical protein